MAGDGRHSTSLPKGFVVRHNIPEGQRVSIQGLEKTFVRLFGTEMKRRAGLDVWDEERFFRERAAAGKPAADVE